MAAWTHILIDGFNAVLESFGSSAGDAVKKSGLKEAAKKAGVSLPDFDLPAHQTRDREYDSNLGNIPSTGNNIPVDGRGKSDIPENINVDTQPRSQFKNMSQMRNPQVMKATHSVECEYRMNQIARQGWLDVCLKQREERLMEEEAFRKIKGR